MNLNSHCCHRTLGVTEGPSWRQPGTLSEAQCQAEDTQGQGPSSKATDVQEPQQFKHNGSASHGQLRKQSDCFSEERAMVKAGHL